MKKKLLFYAPNHYDIDVTIFDQLQKSDQYEVVKLTSKKYLYKNSVERIQNFLGKIFLKRVLKKEWTAKKQIDEINANGPFDLCLIFRPDLLEVNVLEKIQKSIPIRKVVYWDSFKKVLTLEKTLPFFTEHFSFEEEDCVHFDLKQISNFYIHKASNKNPDYDAFFLGAKDSRLDNVKRLFEYLYNKGWKAKGLVIGKKSKHENTDFIEITDQSIPFSECYTFSENTKIVVDICHPNQKGLSIRPFEALGLKRKLITNNSNVKHYDFYNESNIFIIEDFNILQIPESFLKTPYQELPESIYEKYDVKKWLQDILCIV